MYTIYGQYASICTLAVLHFELGYIWTH